MATTAPRALDAPSGTGSAAPASVSHAHVNYRADIDGLRAIAVSLVVLYHAGIAALPGGFIGIDVFLVISGYLITSVIVADLKHGRFSFAEFYRRRIKRLLPAYAVVAFATLAAGLLISLPFHLRDTAQGVATSAVYLSNFWFWREIGYFSGPSEIKPFLHTWSLSVEEQFYVVFPPILFFAAWAKRGRAFNTILFGAVLLGSLALAQLLLMRDPSASFYLLPLRAWELMIGAGLALAGWAAPGDARVRNVLVGLGLALIVASALLLRADASFPGLAALPACAGTALILWAGGRGDGVGRTMLENRPMVFVGQISYSLYLWHWPLFAYYRYYFFQVPPPLAIALMLVALSGLLAWMSWHLVEAPLRRRERLPGWRSFGFAAGVSGALLAVSLWIVSEDGLPERYGTSGRLSLAPVQTELLNDDCGGRGKTTAGQANACLFGSRVGNPSVALWGDSHAQMLINSLDTLYAKYRKSFIYFAHRGGCPPIAGLETQVGSKLVSCSSFAEQTINHINNNKAIRTVVFAARWSHYIKGYYGPMDAGRGIGVSLRPVTGLSIQPIIPAYLARFERTVERLVAAGKRVVIVLPVPEMGYHVPQVLAMLMVRGDDPNRLALPRSVYLDRNREVLAAMRDLARDPCVTLIDPTRDLCDARRCRMMIGDVPAFADDDHLSRAAADRLAPEIFSATLSLAERAARR